MARSRASAKAAGTRFESIVVDELRHWLGDHVERRAKTGARDRGDVAGVRDSYGRRIVVECKDYGGQIKPAEWLAEARLEAEHDDAHVGVVVAKRRGVAAGGRQYVILELEDLAKLLTPPTPNTPQE